MKTQKTLEHSVASRRRFILGTFAVGAGFTFKVLQTSAFGEFLSPKSPAQSVSPNVWVTIDPDGTTTITVSKSEMGQGIRTSLAMIVAEEMDADWSKVVVRQARPDTNNGSLSTGGSGSTTGLFTTLRTAGAAVRAVMISAAAKTWGIADSACSTSNGFVLETSGTRKISYGDLTDAAVGITPPASPTLKAVANFKLIGTPQVHIDAPKIVNGTAVYGIDARLPGMKYAVIARPPAIGASVSSYDAADALKISGVVQVLQINAGIAVVADNTWAAMKGRDALKIQWNMGPNTALSSASISQTLKNSVGTIPDYPANSVKKIEAIYELPFLAHSTMEPMNCLVNVKTNGVDVWAPTQSGDSIRSAVASAAGVSASSVIVNTTLMGGGFGRRSSTDYATYATQISKAVKAPILLLYTKSDDLKNDYYRSASYHVMRSGVDSSNRPTGWIHRAASQYSGIATAPNYPITGANASSAGVSGVPVPMGVWRSVESTIKNFVNECFIDEIAFATGTDPYQFRRSLLAAGRLKTILDAVATKADWSKTLPSGWGRGISTFQGYGAYIGVVAEVSVSTSGVLKVERVVAVVDCGLAINPLGVEAQIQGAICDGIATALTAEITIENGAIKQSSWSDFEWLRMNESPKIEVYLQSGSQSPSGMGEVGYPAVAPAVCNAIFNASGQRIRTLPAQKSFVLAVEQEQAENSDAVTISPSPFKESFKIEGKISGTSANFAEIRIVNIIGSEIMSVRENIDAEGKFSTEIRVSPAPAGIYFAQIQCGGHLLTRKIVKE